MKNCAHHPVTNRAHYEEQFWTTEEVGIPTTSFPQDVVHTMTNDQGLKMFWR
jgi:hypothetical protein